MAWLLCSIELSHVLLRESLEGIVTLWLLHHLGIGHERILLLLGLHRCERVLAHVLLTHHHRLICHELLLHIGGHHLHHLILLCHLHVLLVTHGVGDEAHRLLWRCLRLSWHLLLLHHGERVIRSWLLSLLRWGGVEIEQVHVFSGF